MQAYPYEGQADPASVGLDQDRLVQAIAAFKRNQSKGEFPGGQMVVRRNGKLVLNEVCGIARGYRPEEGIPTIPVTPDTPFPALSAGKPLAAVAIAMLEDRGVIDVNAPIAAYIPDFSRNGKGEITVLDVLTHRSGIMLPELIADSRLWGDREVILAHLVAAKPAYPRGTMAYAAYEFGWILSELFLQVEGRSLPDFITAEISTPLGLPALLYGLAGREISTLARTYWLGKDRYLVSGTDVAEGFEERNNSIEQIDSLNPAVSIVTDAASLAAFYDFLLAEGVTRSGKRLISQETIRKYTSLNAAGLDRNNRTWMSLGRGFMLGSRFVSTYGWWGTQNCFGHAGGFSSLAFGDKDTKLAVGFVTNGNQGFMDLARRFIPLAHKLRSACR